MEHYFLFGRKRLDARLVGFETGTADEIDAIRDCRHHRVEALANCLGLAGQIDDQGAVVRSFPNACRLSRQDGRRHGLERTPGASVPQSPAIIFWQTASVRFGRNVSRCRSGAPGGDNQAASCLVAKFDNPLLSIVACSSGITRSIALPRAGQHFVEILLNRRSAPILVLAARGPVADGHHPDAGNLGSPTSNSLHSKHSWPDCAACPRRQPRSRAIW